MKNTGRKFAILTVIACLVFGGCAAATQRNLETFTVPDRPVLNPVVSGAHIQIPENDFVDLTKYVIELEALAEKCNVQAEVFNEAR
jgi:hypothetical protein